MNLRKKLLSKFILIATISLILTAVFSTVSFWFIFSAHEMKELRNHGEIVANSYNNGDNPDLLAQYSLTYLRLTLINSNGDVIFESDPELEKEEMENHSNRPEVQAAFETGIGEDQRMSDSLGEVTYYYAVKTADGSVIRVSRTIESVISIFMRVLPYIFGVSGAVFLGCILFSRHSTTKIIQPIENMGKNLDISPYEELIPLSKTIRSQEQLIIKQMKHVQLEKDRIETLIQNMSEGFVMIDMDKNILMSNYAAEKLLGENSGISVNDSFLNYAHNEIVCECIEKSFDGESHSGEAYINKRTLQIIANPVYSNDEQKGVILLIIDVSAKNKAEKMRQEFTANVSHELKTPLTSILGYAEMIAGGIVAPEDVRGFAGKIYKESGRLLALIGDIIELSQLDENAERENFIPVDLYAISNEVSENLKESAEKSNITISVEGEKSIVSGNRSQLYELIYNLCDNAIRYNKPDGSVKISLAKDDDKVVLKVSDTGIGIPEKHIKRVFERFYRVDKSRSKETGGTGLGLAIVKHIVERHGGVITLDSSENGTVFTVVFEQIM